MRAPATVPLFCVFACACLSRVAAALAAEFPVAVVEGSQSAPDVAWVGTISLVVWQDERNASTTGRDVYAARLTGSGAVLDPAGLAVSAATGPEARPKVASDGQGFLVVWQDDRDGNGVWQVRAARVTEGGATPDGEGVIVADTAQNDPYPDVTWAGSHYLVAWQQDSGGTGVDIYVARVSAGGVPMDVPPLVADGADGHQDSVSLAHGDGKVLVAYRDPAGGYYIKGVFVDSQGSPSATFAVATAASTQKSPAVAFGEGLFLVAWEDYRDGNPDIYAARVEPSGNVIENVATAHIPVAVSFDASAKSPAVTFDGAAFVVAWEEDRNDPTGYDIYSAQVSSAGGIVAPGAAPLGPAAADQLAVSVAAGPSATAFVWADHRYAPPMPADVFACLVQTNQPPAASTSFAPGAPSEGDVVTLDAAGSYDPEGAALSYRWMQVSGPDVGVFQDALSTPDFVAPEWGAPYDLVFSLEVSDGCTWSGPDLITIPVDADDDPPVAVANDVSANECEIVTLDGGASFDPEGGGLTFQWSQQGLPVVTFDDPASAAPSFTAPDLSGDYTLTFSLTVNDGTQDSTLPAEATVSVAADNDPPVASAGGQMTVLAGAEVTLDGGASRDPEGQPLVYGWTQVWGPAVTFDDAGLPLPSFTAPASDAEIVLVFTLTVRDDGGNEDSDQAQVWVSQAALAAPVASGLQAEVLSHESARITWSTDIEAKGRVTYGTTPALGFESDEEAAFVTAHEVVLGGLRAGATYYFEARSTGTGDAWTVSEVDEFTLPGPPPSDDLDADGIPDDWERANGLDPGDPGDASLDPDRDGLSNLEEYRHLTDPNLRDTDLDGAPDGYEVAHGTSPVRADSKPPPVRRDESCGMLGLPSVSLRSGVSCGSALLLLLALALMAKRGVRRSRS